MGILNKIYEVTGIILLALYELLNQWSMNLHKFAYVSYNFNELKYYFSFTLYSLAHFEWAKLSVK